MVVKCPKHFGAVASPPFKLLHLKSSFLEAVLFHLIEEIRFRAAKVDNLGTAVPVLLLYGALLAVVGVRDSRPSTDHTTSLHITKIITVLEY